MIAGWFFSLHLCYPLSWILLDAVIDPAFVWPTCLFMSAAYLCYQPRPGLLNCPSSPCLTGSLQEATLMILSSSYTYVTTSALNLWPPFSPGSSVHSHRQGLTLSYKGQTLPIPAYLLYFFSASEAVLHNDGAIRMCGFGLKRKLWNNEEGFQLCLTK